jgi:3-hydroxybutyryl-CoA dehydrogenase
VINKVGVVGGGQMGAGIAELGAKAGLDVIVHEVSEELAKAAQARIEKSLGRAVERGKLSAEDSAAAMGRLSFVSDLNAMADRDLVIEAIIENEELKKSVFAQLDEIVESADAILATNTSSIPITRIATATSRPESVVGMHFFNPPVVMPLVEIVQGMVTSESVVAAAGEFASAQLGKTVVVAKDRAGFIVNMLLVPYIIDAIRMYEEGYASKEDIDAGMVNGANYPMGPLTLSDLIGNDTMLFVAEALFEEFREARYAPPPLLKRMVEAGLLGRKTGKGFYDYS